MNVKFLLSTSFIAASLTSLAQDGKTYAITGNGAGDFAWSNIRQLDVSTGKVTKDIYQNNKTAFVLVDAASKAPVSTVNFKYTQAGYTNTIQMKDEPTVTMVAAAAFDKRHDKLFFTPMRLGELRWLDVSTSGDAPKFYTNKVQLLNTLDLMDEANHITRMDIAADGNGYAITNDGNHLIRFTTGKKTEVTDLGNLIDAEANKSGISIHNKCTSWGGDMIADAYGKLYVISAMHQVFKIDIDSRIATHIGTITGLPGNFTTNGAAVTENDNIVVSSANSFEGYYTFKLDNLAAVKIEGSDKMYNASDLANGNLLFQKEANAKKAFDITTTNPVAPINDTRIFPNPVTANQFRVLFDNQKAGRYTIALTDLSGRAVFGTFANVSGKMQQVNVQIGKTIGKGVYLVKVTDASNQLVFTERVVVQ